MTLCVPLPQPNHFFNSPIEQWKRLLWGMPPARPGYHLDRGWRASNVGSINAAPSLLDSSSSFPLFQPLPTQESLSELEPADPDFYKIGYVRSMRAYGVEFKEGPDGFGVYASKDVEPLRRARVIMEIPLELMLTIRQKPPWMFFPDIVPIGHPIFDIINSTNPETEWDLRMACLLLYAFDKQDNFWQLYGDFLPSADECTSLLLATEYVLVIKLLADERLEHCTYASINKLLRYSSDECWHCGCQTVYSSRRRREIPTAFTQHMGDLSELQDATLATTMKQQQGRALDFWERHWHNGAPLKIKRLARDPERFTWAVSMAQTRSIGMQIRIGALVQESNMLIPYADMLNHSFQPNCFLHWRFKDRMLEVMINAGQRIRKGDEGLYISGPGAATYVSASDATLAHGAKMTINYLGSQKNNMFMQRYGFSSPVNPWDAIEFSGNARIHLDSFLSVFNISGLPDEYYHKSPDHLPNVGGTFVDGAVLAAARALPSWSERDLPALPSVERKAAKELQEECQQMLAQFPTTLEQDQEILDSTPQSRTLEAAIKYRLHRKLYIQKVVRALDMYQELLLY